VSQSVADLLRLSRAEHLAKKCAAGRANSDGVVTEAPNYPKAEAHIREAIRLREAAHALDPEMADPAWADDLAKNKGVSSESLLTWFRHYLTIP